MSPPKRTQNSTHNLLNHTNYGTYRKRREKRKYQENINVRNNTS